MSIVIVTMAVDLSVLGENDLRAAISELQNGEARGDLPSEFSELAWTAVGGTLDMESNRAIQDECLDVIDWGYSGIAKNGQRQCNADITGIVQIDIFFRWCFFRIS